MIYTNSAMEKYNKIKLNMTNYFPKIKNFEENIYKQFYEEYEQRNWKLKTNKNKNEI